MRRPRTALSVTAVAVAVLIGAAVGLVATKAVLATTATSDCATGGAVADAANNPGLVSDCEALLAARDRLAGSATLNWSAGTPIEEWDGVVIRGTPARVGWLYLRARGLDGSIPAELGNLPNLEWLLLESNQLSGEIPPELGNLSNLESLRLGSNQLTGEIPPELGNLSSLQSLSLYSNKLSGETPTS